MGWLIAAAAFYIFFLSGRSTAITSTARTQGQTVAPGGPAISQSGNSTQISIPGVGTYTNVGGGEAIGITVSGDLISTVQNALGLGGGS